MPNLPLPDEDYLGSPDRTTGEFQAQIDNLQNWVRALQAELSALSTTTLGEGAVRGVGNGDGLLADKNVLDARLATTGNLGSMALESAEDYATTTDGGSVVFTGSDTSLTQLEMGSPGAGLYIVRFVDGFAGNQTGCIYWDGESSTSSIVNVRSIQSSPAVIDWNQVNIGSTGVLTVSSLRIDLRVGDGQSSAGSLTINQVKKV